MRPTALLRTSWIGWPKNTILKSYVIWTPPSAKEKTARASGKSSRVSLLMNWVQNGKPRSSNRSNSDRSKLKLLRRNSCKFNSRFWWLFSPRRNWPLHPVLYRCTRIGGLEGRVDPGFPGAQARCWQTTQRKPAALEQNLTDTPPPFHCGTNPGYLVQPNMGTDTMSDIPIRNV